MPPLGVGKLEQSERREVKSSRWGRPTLLTRSLSPARSLSDFPAKSTRMSYRASLYPGAPHSSAAVTAPLVASAKDKQRECQAYETVRDQANQLAHFLDAYADKYTTLTGGSEGQFACWRGIHQPTRLTQSPPDPCSRRRCRRTLAERFSHNRPHPRSVTPAFLVPSPSVPGGRRQWFLLLPACWPQSSYASP